MVTKNADKQRKSRLNAPLHILRKNISGHLSKELRAKYKKKAITLRKGDLVLILRGDYKKKQGKIANVDTKSGDINIEGLQITKKDGKTVPIKIDPSNVVVLDLYKDDEKRFKRITGEKYGK